MVNIVNNTPHVVNIIAGATYNSDCRKFKGGKVVKTYQPTTLLNATIKMVDDGTLDGVPCVHRQVVAVDKVKDNALHIVSAQYVSACKELGLSTDNLLTVGQAVVDDNHHIIGVVGLVKN